MRPGVWLTMLVVAACGQEIEPLDSQLGQRLNEEICQREFTCYPDKDYCRWEQMLDHDDCLSACTIDRSLAADCLHAVHTLPCPDDGTIPYWDLCLPAILCPDEVGEDCTGW